MKNNSVSGRHFVIPTMLFVGGTLAGLLDEWLAPMFWLAVALYALGTVSVFWIFVQTVYDGRVDVFRAKTAFVAQLRQIDQDGGSTPRKRRVTGEKADEVEQAVDELALEMRAYRSDWVSQEKVYLKVERGDGQVMTAAFPKVRGIRRYLQAYASRTVSNRPNSQVAMKSLVNMSRPKHEIVARGFETLGLTRKENPTQANSRRVISHPVDENAALLSEIAQGNFELLAERWA